MDERNNWIPNYASGSFAYDANLHHTITKGIHHLPTPMPMPQWRHHPEIQNEMSYNISAQVSSGIGVTGTVCEPSNMDKQNHKSPRNSTPLAINWKANNASGLLSYDANMHYPMKRGRNEIDQLPIPIQMPQWMPYQQMPHNYVEFLAENGYPELQKEISCNLSAQVSACGLASLSQMKQEWNEKSSSAFQAYTKPDAAAPKHPPRANNKRSREKAYAADRYRRLRISQSMDALQELLPHSKERGKEAMLDDVVDQIKYLQHQVKDLSRSRLLGASTSNSFIFLEGHGHYLVREQMLDGPLEEMLRKLLEFSPSSATELLQSRGLIVMPMNLRERLCEPTEILNMQEKGVSFISK